MERKILGSILRPVKLDTVLPTARHRRDISSKKKKLVAHDAKMGSAIPNKIRRYNATSAMIGFYFFRTEVNFVSREEKEVSVLHMINEHASHAVRFYGYAQWFDAIGLVMEYLPCGNLFQLLIRSKAELGALLRYRMCFEIAEGLYEIHNLPRLSETTRTKVVHGDVKAENILLTDRLHCKIGDFGSSKILMATGCTQFTLLEQNQENKEFTPIYVPPEFLINTAISITPSFDVYSYSVIIYLVLKRGLPFTKMTRSIYLDNVKKGVMPEPARDNILKDECKINKVSDLAVRILETVFLRCQAINPANRPPMREVMEELKAHSLLTVHKKRIYDQVVQARTNARVYDPRQEDHKCQTLDKFVPPLFRSRAGKKPKGKTTVLATQLYVALNCFTKNNHRL